MRCWGESERDETGAGRKESERGWEREGSSIFRYYGEYAEWVLSEYGQARLYRQPTPISYTVYTVPGQRGT